MSAEKVVLAYAAAFEETYKDDDWTRLAQYFADDATYEVRGGPFACEITGRDAIFRGLKKSIDGLDRRCDSRRIIVTDGPTTRTDPAGDEVSIAWEAQYEWGDAPPVTLVGRSIATVADGRITLLVDEYVDGEMADVAAWMREHGQDLDGAYV